VQPLPDVGSSVPHVRRNEDVGKRWSDCYTCYTSLEWKWKRV